MLKLGLRAQPKYRFGARAISLRPNFEKYKLKEQPPGYVVGTVNEATPQAEIDYFHGSYHWSYERLVAVSLVPLAVTPFVASVDYPVLDSILAATLLIHSHIGFTSCIIDYIPKRVYGIWHKFARYLLTFGTTVALYGIYEMETTDVGLSNLIKKIWAKEEAPASYYL